MAERPLYTLYKNLKAQNYDVPDDYNKFESALTRDGKGGADNRHAIYENLKAQNFDVPSTYERFYSALFEPRSKTSSRAKGGSVPMSAADRARFSAGAAAISASAQQTMNNAGRYNRLKQRKQKQQKDFGRVNLGTNKTPYGGDANNVVKDDFAYNPETGKAGVYVTSDNENVYSLPEAEQMQAILDKQNDAYQVAVDTGEIPSAFDVRDKKGNYDLQENIGKNGTYLTEEGAQKQFDKKLADAYARKKEIEALIAEDNRQHGNPLLSYGASIGASNGRTAEQSDYRNKLATSLALVKQQIGALEAVKQYPTSSFGEDALKALDNTAFTAKTWDFGLTDFAIMGQMERIKTKMDNNIPLSGSDKMLLKSKLGADAATALEDEKMGNVYRWTKIAGQSLPFMADFFLTGGYGGITKGISRGALKFAAKRGMGKVGAAILKNTGIVAGDVIGSYAMAGTEQALKTGADIMQRHLGNLYQDENGDYKFGTFDENGNLLHEGGESIGTALYKGMTSAMVENYTEKLFGHNYGIKKGAVNFMEKHGMNASAEFFKNIGKSGWYTNSKKWMEKFGINGFAEEVMEEEIGIPLHALLDGEGKVSDLLDAKQQLDIIGGMAISVGSMYAMGAGSRPVKGIYNRAQYYRFRNKVNVADSDAQNLMGDNWADIKDKIDNATNEQMGGVLADILRQRDTMTKEQINAAVNYGVNLMKMRGYNIAKTAEMNAREITNEPTTPEEQHQADIDNAYSEGHDADDADKHDIQIQQEDQMKTLAAALGISEQQLSAMSDEELESLTGQDDKLDQAIYDYQLSSARYQGVVDDAQDKVDLAAHQAEQRVDMYTDQSRGSVRNATIKASGGLEDYGVYIISGNVATHDDGSIDVSNSDGMILYYDPTTNSVEHADALMFAELGEELPADDVKAQAVSDAKENAIKEVAGIIDGTVEVGSQFNVTDTDGTEHTYEVLADYGDGTAAISIDGNVVENPYSLADLQQMKDLEDQKRLESAKAEREQMEKERAAQQNQETEETQPSFDFNQILNDNGNVVLVDVLDKDGNTKYPDSRLFLIRDAGAKAKVVELKSDGTIVPHAVNKEDVATISSMSLDEYKQAMPESSMIEDNSGEESDEDSQLENLGLPKGSEIWMSGDGFGRPKENTLSRVVGIDEQGSIILEDKDGKKWSASFDYINNHRELPPLDENTNIVNEENNQSESNAEENTSAPEQTPAITLEDGTIVPMLEDGNPDFSKLTAAQTAELYDTQFGEDADSIVSGYVSDAKKALDKASNMTVKGKTFVEQKAAKDAKEKAIADAQAAYDSAIAIRDAYNERQLAKVEDTADGRKELIEKARRKFARLKSAVKDDAEAVSQLYRDTIGSLLHRLYDSTGIDVTDTTPLTAEEYVASNLGAHSLNYEGTETSKGVKQETGLSREDFAKTQLLAADGKGTTIDALVHSLWENRPSNLESLDTQDIRNALIGVLNSGFKASEARNFVENIRIAQAENILEEQKRAQENADYAEQHKAEPEAELKAKSDEKAELKAKSEEKLDNESDNESNDLDNDLDNEKTNDKINDNINVPEDATDENPLGAERDESDLPFSAKENGKQQTTAERAADVEKNKVDDMKVVDNIVGEKTRKAFERLAKMMGANIQWQYSDKLGNGWIQETTDADGNVHRTIFITLDSSITEGAQFIFGHEMTHQIKNLNPAAYNELTQLVLDTYGSDAFDKAVNKTMQRYSDAGFSGRARDYYAEEVVADAVGEMIRDLNLAHTLAMKMSHPLLAAIHEILQKIKLAFFGTEYSDVTKNIIRSIEQAYVKTAKGEVTNSETGEDVSFSLRQKPEPKKKGVGYKVFVLKDGKLYPPMVANPDGAATPVGVWLDADAAPIAGESKTGRPQVKQGGKGTQGGSGKLAYRPGWHLGVVPYAIQFNRKDAEGNKTLFPKNFVFAEVEYAADVDYQEEARQEGINPSGKYQHSLAGLKHLPTDGYYMYRTNPNPETDPWVITGAMKVNRILTRAEQADLVSKAGREPQQIQEGDIVTDDVVNSINQEIADAPKFSLKVYHGSGADFTEFDFDHMGEGAGSQAFGWGGYVTSSEKIGKSYAGLTIKNRFPSEYNTAQKQYTLSHVETFILEGSDKNEAIQKVKGLYNESLDKIEHEHPENNYAISNLKERIETLDEMEKGKLPIPTMSLYEVDIPEDNGSNYIEFYEDATPEFKEQIKSVLANGLPSELKKMPEYKEAERKFYEENGTDESFEKSLIDDALFELERRKSNGDAYNALSVAVGDKLASKILSSLGYTGIKYPAGTIMGGVEEDEINYVIFKPEDMKITEHTKFSIKTYHGSQASFDKFDHSFMGSGEGAQAYGWGTYVSEVEGIAKAYAKSNATIHSDNGYKEALYKYREADFNYHITETSYKNAVKNLKEKEQLAHPKIKNLENELKEAKSSGDTISVGFLETALKNWNEVLQTARKEVSKYEDTILPNDKDVLEKAKKRMEELMPKRNLYSVDIPDDTGRNYIGWDEPLGAAKIMRLPKVFKADGWEYKKDGMYDTYKINGNEHEVWLEPSLTTGKELYRDLTNALGSDKAASEFLSKAGFVGVKVIADRTTGGNKEGKMNYVIFDENNAQITSHTKFSLRLKSAIEETETNPSDAQKESGNYKKGHIKFGGYDYTIENPKGSTRSGKDADGKEWKVTMHDTYGYIRGKFGKDGDHLDMFINDKADLDNWNGDVFVVDQVNPDGSFDEHKVMYGYDSMDDAKKAYLANYSDGWQGLGNITGVSKGEFDKWLDTSNRKLKPFADYAKVKFSLKDIKPVGVGAFGNIYNQFRGNAKAAIEFLKKVRGGEAVGALHHKDIGDIDLVWGKEGTGHSDGYGLSKLVKYHPEVLDNLQEILNDMRVVSSSKNRVNLESETHKAGVRLTWDGERKSWLLTAFKKETSASDKRTDTAATSLEGDTALSQTEGSAAKIDNSSETAKENGEKVDVEGTKFSLKDEKTMFGMHNISIDKLRKAIKQGGFAAPSMGVVDSKNGIYSGYGEITLIPKAEKIAKRTGKNIGTYAADAWTPIYPHVEKKFGGNGSDVAYNDIESVPKEMQRLTRNAINSFMDGREANGLAYLYLQEKGKTPELVHVEGKYPKKLHDEVKSILGKLDGIYSTTDEQKEELLDLFIREVYDGNREEFDNDIKKFIRKDEEFIKKRPNSNIAKNKQLDVDWMKEHGYDYGALSRFVDGILRDAETSGKVDENATMKAAQQYIQDNSMNEDFDSWKEKLNDRYNVEEVIFAGYKPDGNRKYLPNTVENAVKVMKQDGKNASVGSASFSHFVASILKPMGTLDQIRKKKGNLTGNYEDVEKFQEKWQPVYDELADKMQPDAEPFESYGMDRLEEVATQKNPKKYAKEEYGVDLTDEDINKLNELIEAVKNDKPSIYFEAKFMRPYGLDEFEKAIVPNDTPSDVVDALKMAGIDVSSYERGNAEDRQKVTMDAINSSDNIRFSLKEEKEKIVADAKANGTYMTAPNGEKTKLDAEQWATVRTTNFKNWFGDWENDPENASKVVDDNGEPMVVWHGRSAEFNTFEKKEGVRFIMGLEDKVKAEGFFFSPDKGLAEEFASNSSRHRGGKANVVPCFLNIRKPMDLTGEDYDRIYEDVTGWKYMVGMDTQDNLWGIMDEEGMSDKIKEKGYDGAIFVEEVDDSYEPTKISYCALDANQIKSAENNNGDFSADNNDIRFSLKSMMAKPEGWKQANKKAIHIAEAIERDPKFSLKNLDGTLIKAGTYFSGGGLVEEGLKGIIDPVVAVEYDEKISGVYRNNFGQHIVTADVRDVDPKELVKQIDGEVEYFHASPVCKNYSQAKSNHAEVELDKETAASTAEFINAIKPKVVTIENVKGYKDSDAMKTITDALDANGYTWDADVYNAADYGGYTNRERLIVRAVREGKLPAKPKKMERKSGWYEAVADIIPTLTEKKNGVAPWMDIRLKADGIDWRNIDKPLYVMGSAYADGKVPHAFADELLPTLRTKSGDVIVMPDGKVYRAMGRVLARVSGVSDDYKMPFSENLSHTIIGNGIPTQLTEHVIAPLLTGSDPKFSIRTYHGTGASFDKFDLSHALEGEGSESFGHGVYVTNSKKIGDNYAQRAKDRKGKFGFDYKIDMSAEAGEMLSHYINKNQDVDKGLENARQDLRSALEMFPDDETLKELSAILQNNNNEIAESSNEAYRYDVDIPDDNGENYLGWNESQNFPLEKWYRLWEITHHGFSDNEYFKDGGARYDKDRIERIIQMKLDSPENGMQKLPTLKGEELYHALEDFFDRERPLRGAKLASRALSEIGFVGIKYPAGMIHGGAEEADYNYVIFDENNANIVGNTRFSLRYDQFEHDLNQWKKDNNLPKDAQRPTIPQRNAGESVVDFLRRVDEYRKQMALWKTAPTYEQHLLSDDTALGEFNRELQRGSVLKRIAFQDSMLAIRKAQEAIMKEVGVDRLNMAEDAYTAENRSHGKGKNEFEEYNNEFLQPLRKAYHQMKKVLGDSYDNVRIYMMAKHGLERDAQMAFKKSLEADYEDVAQRSAAYKAYKGDMNRIINDSDLEFGRVDFTTWRQRDNALRVKYSPSYMDYRYDKNGIVYDYSGLSALFDGSDFEEAAHKLVKDIESKYVAETHDLWDATNAATKKILRDGYKAGMMSKDTYQYVRDMYSHYIPLRGWDGTTADQVWDYIGGGKGAFNQTLKKAHGRTSIADDPIAYIENMAESGILLNNKNWVKQHLMLLAQNHPTSLLTLSKAWYVKSVDDNGNEEWVPATPQITSQMNSNQVKAAIDAFEKKMEQMAQTGDATQKRDGLNIAYPQTHSEEREHEVRVMKDGEEYVIYVNGDPQLAQAMNNTRAHRVREIQSGKLDRAAAWLGRKMAAAYTSFSPLFIPSNYFRDLTMTLASTAIREDAKYNYLLRKNLATSWNLGFMLRDYQNGKLRDKVNNGNATPKEQMFYDFMMNGGETGFVSSLDVEDLKKKFKNDLKDLDRWKTNPVKVGHTIMDGIEFLNRAIEDSNRFAVYMTSIQYGRSIDEAVNDAKDVTLNFNRKGTGEYGWQMIRNLYLFINPAVQSLQTLGALVKHHPFKFTAVTASWLASGVLVPIVNAALISMLGGDDDKDKYWQFTKWDRRNNLIMWVPFTHEYIKIPLAQEFRAFYGIGDMIASKMMGGELAEESWSQYAEDLLGQVVDMLPLDPTGYDGNIAVSLMPNAIRPVFELAFNVDFTGKPLFKETEYNKYDPNFTKAYVGTPDWLVRASKMVNSIGNDYPDVQQNSIDAFGDPRYNLNNPAVVDHVLSSYLGGAYTMGSQVLGVLTKSLNDPKEIKVADIPLVSKFVSNPDDRPVTKKQGDEFWNMKENHDRAANTLSKLKKQAKDDGDYSMLERFYGSDEYKQYKQDDVKVKKYEEDKKKERAEESGEEYRPHKLNAEDIYKAHATPKDDFEDLKLKQLYTKLNGFKTSYDLLVDTAPSQSDAYYNTNKAAIDAIDEISLDKQEISELKKGFLDDGKDAYNAEDMKQIRDLRKKILAVLEKANKVVVANQKAKAEK